LLPKEREPESGTLENNKVLKSETLMGIRPQVKILKYHLC